MLAPKYQDTYLPTYKILEKIAEGTEPSKQSPLLEPESSNKIGEGDPRKSEIANKVQKDEEKRVKIELEDLVNDLKSVDQLVDTRLISEKIMKMVRVTEIIEAFPAAKEHFLSKFGLVRLVDILKNEKIDTMIIHSVMKIINHNIENDIQFQEKICLAGVLSEIVRYTEARYERCLRVEAAYYLGHVIRPPSLFKMMITAGGLKGYVEILDENLQENCDLTCLGIDSVIYLLEFNFLGTEELCHIFCKFGVISKLAALLEPLRTFQDENACQYLTKTLNLLLKFAMCDNKEVRKSFCEDRTLSCLQASLENSQADLFRLCKILEIIKFISKEAAIASKFQKNGMTSIIIKLISEEVAWPLRSVKKPDIVIDLVEILANMCKKSDICKEEIAMKGGIKQLIYLVQSTTKGIERITLPFLCELVKSSQVAREKFWKEGGPRILLKYLEDEDYQEKILELLIEWRGYEEEEIDDFLVEPRILRKIIGIIHKADKIGFQRRVELYARLIKCSDKLARKLAESQEFLKEIAERLGGDSIEVRIECANPTAIVKKELLEILLHFCEKHSDPLVILNQYKLLLNVKRMMENETAVFVKSRASQLWGLCLVGLKESMRISEG